MEPFTVLASAPGKLILFGEHAVVYGYSAIATSLSDLRVPVEVTVEAAEPSVLTLTFPELSEESSSAGPAARGSGASASAAPPPQHLTFSWPLASLLAAGLLPLCACEHSAGGPEAAPAGLPLCTTPTPSLVAALDALTAHIPALAYRRTCASLLFLACATFSRALAAPTPPSLAIRVLPPTLPIGAGLGSSAALSTAASAALLQAALRWGSSASSSSSSSALPSPLCPATLHAINGWAFCAETLFHGTPSGLDNTVATHGGSLLYSRAGGVQSTRPLRAALPLRLLLVNTGVPKDTAALVAGVAASRAQLPGVVNPLLASIGALVEQAVLVLEGSSGQGAGDPAAAAAAAVQRLVRVNHSILNALGVGHAALDAVVAAAGERGLAGKLTGAGGGGCAYIVLGSSQQAEEEAALVAALSSRGCHCFTSSVGGEGVRLH